MSSNIARRYRTNADMKVIDRVLMKAGLGGTEAVVHSDTRGDAVRYLVEKFQSGLRTEDELAATLMSRLGLS